MNTVNDFTIRAATVNGSGSQSANLVITNAIFRMGIPVAPKNVFPSNIEGLPTWFDVRISPQGYQCRSRNINVLVALNPATWADDVASVAPGGIVIHEAGFAVRDDAQRSDVTYYAVPFAKLAKEHISDGAMRKYLTNMIYVGVVAYLCGIPLEQIESALSMQFRTKPKAVQSNMDAVKLGAQYAQEQFGAASSFVVQPLSGTGNTILLEGNSAAALGCIMGGCTVVAWYPITPSSSLCESFIAYAEKFRTDKEAGERKAAIVQAEDELAAIGMVLGAGWAGARAMTSTSGPGLSLMAEFAGLGYYAEIPGVIFDIQRAGPSTGLPTRTLQADLGFTYTLSHGDTKHIVLLPGTVTEAYEFAMQAFDLADRFQTPVFVLSDLDLGMNRWMTGELPYPEKPFDRGKVLDADALANLQSWGRYRDVDGDGIPYRTLPGTPNERAGYFTRGSGHDENATYSEDPVVFADNLDRLARKHETARAAAPAPLVDDRANGTGIIAYGTTHHAVREARDLLRERGIEVDYLRICALPLAPEVQAFIERHDRVYVVEQNRDGQMFTILRSELPAAEIAKLESIRHYNGVPIDAYVIVDPLLSAETVVA